MLGRKSADAETSWIREQRDTLRREGTVRLPTAVAREAVLICVLVVCAVGYAVPLWRGDPHPWRLSRPLAWAAVAFLSLLAVALTRMFIRLGRVAVVVDTHGVHITNGLTMPWPDILSVEVRSGFASRRHDMVQLRMSQRWATQSRQDWVERGGGWRSWVANRASRADQDQSHGQGRILLPMLRPRSGAITQWLLSESDERRVLGSARRADSAEVGTEPG